MTAHILITQDQLEQLAKTSAMLSRESHKESVSRLFDDMKNRDVMILSKLETIEAQVLKTNGRVTTLEKTSNDNCVKVSVMDDQIKTQKSTLNRFITAFTTISTGVIIALVIAVIKLI